MAALAIPVLFNNINDAQANSGLKKAYSEFSQALNMIVQQNSGLDITSLSIDELVNDFCSVLKCVQKGGSDVGLNLFGATVYKSYKNTYAAWSIPSTTNTTHRYFSLPNGEIIQMWIYSSGSTINATDSAHAAFIIDINGQKNPNMWGFDLYRFWIIYRNGMYIILPTGYKGDTWVDTDPCKLGDTAQTQDSSKACTAIRLFEPQNLP